MSGPTPPVSAELVRDLARANGLDLSVERAAALAPGVAALLAGGARLAALDPGTLPPPGPGWPREEGEVEAAGG